MERTVLHIVGGESRARAEQARVAFALGHHAEVYADLNELLDRPPLDGIVMAADSASSDGVARLIEQLGHAGIWLPVVMTAGEIELERVVAAIRSGALDYLSLPLEIGIFARRLHALLLEAGAYTDRRRLEVEALQRIAQLSRREREVLALLSSGLANKEIAQHLAISPRTVEIHRANMMAKLGAGHAADAIKAWIAAGLDRGKGGVGPAATQRPSYRVGRPLGDARDGGQPQTARRAG